VAINDNNKLAKCLKKIRRCKVDKRGETTRENISIVIRTSIVIHLRSYHDVRKNLSDSNLLKTFEIRLVCDA
jgi:hypothetical protein